VKMLSSLQKSALSAKAKVVPHASLYGVNLDQIIVPKTVENR
jgi:hypothetical protein